MNNMKLVHWPMMGGLLHLVQQGRDWAGPHPAKAPHRCTKCNSPPVNGQCINHRIAVMMVRWFAVSMCQYRVNNFRSILKTRSRTHCTVLSSNIFRKDSAYVIGQFDNAILS